MLGGVALGIATAAVLLAAGLGEGWLTFRAALLLGAVIGTLLVYGAVYLPAARRRMLCVIFDHHHGDVLVRRTDLAQPPARYVFEDVIAFRLVERPNGRQGCALVMETGSGGDFVLLIDHHPCQQEPMLSQFAGYLHGYLDTLFNQHSTDPVPPQPHVPD